MICSTICLGVLLLERARCGGDEDHLVDALLELLEAQRAVVEGARQAEAELDQVVLAGHVAVVHAAQLRDGDVALVDDAEEILREVVEQRVRRRAGRAAVQVARVVLDAGAEADLADHLQVVAGALLQALGLEQLAFLVELGEPLLQLRLDALQGALDGFLAGDEVAGRKER